VKSNIDINSRRVWSYFASMPPEQLQLERREDGSVVLSGRLVDDLMKRATLHDTKEL